MQAQTLKCTPPDGSNCPNTAHRGFKWPWGLTGVTCREHMPHLQSLADQLQRPIEFTEPFDAATTVAVTPPAREQRFRDVSNMAELDDALNLVLGEIRECWHKVEDLESAHARLSDQAANLKAKLAEVQTQEAPKRRAPALPKSTTTVVDGASDDVRLQARNDVDEASDQGPETPVSGRQRGGVVEGQGGTAGSGGVADRVVETSRETPKKNG